MFSQSKKISSDLEYLKGLESSAMNSLLEKLVTNELPDAIDLIMLGPTEAEMNQPGFGFARFAARLFAEVGAPRIRNIAVSHDISVIRLSSTEMFWVRFNADELSEEDVACVLAAEAAMNRLLFVKETFAIQQEKATYSEEDCSLADAYLVDTAVSVAPDHAKGKVENPLLTLFSIEARRGGEWDVRTRFALAAETLRLPYRLAYRFDCNVEKGVFSIDYLAPLPSWASRFRFNKATGMWEDVSASASSIVARYSLSVGAILASIAFGASVGIRKVRIAAHPGRLDADTSMVLYIDRLPFLSSVLVKIANGDMSWMETFVESSGVHDEHVDAALALQHVEIKDDKRPLPQELQGILFAEKVCDLDIASTLESDPWESVHAAAADRDDSPLAAVAVLEDVVASVDAKANVQIAELPGEVQPLYCEDFTARIALSLTEVQPHTTLVRYSDAAYTARSMLCDLYRTMNEPKRAFQLAQECIEIAPSSVTSYVDAANAVIDQQHYGQAIPYLEKALLFATQHSALAFIYYRLAFALWQTGKQRAGLACYVMSGRFGSARADAIQQEMSALLSEMGYLPEVDASPVPDVGEARAILQEEGIPVAPTWRLRELVATAVIGLTDAGILNAAAPLAQAAGFMSSYRDELYAVAASLYGT